MYTIHKIGGQIAINFGTSQHSYVCISSLVRIKYWNLEVWPFAGSQGGGMPTLLHFIYHFFGENFLKTHFSKLSILLSTLILQIIDTNAINFVDDTLDHKSVCWDVKYCVTLMCFVVRPKTTCCAYIFEELERSFSRPDTGDVEVATFVTKRNVLSEVGMFLALTVFTCSE